MMKKAFLFAPLVASILMAGCSGNSSSSTLGGQEVVVPTKVDKTMAAVEWTTANEAEMASHVYRVFANSESLSLGFAAELDSASLTTLASLFRVAGNRSCNISGTLRTENLPLQCFDAVDGNKVDCDADNAIIQDDVQQSRATDCQDGSTSARYLDGYFNITSRDDFSNAQEIRKSSIFSAIGEVPKLDQDGVQETNLEGDPVTETVTDYQLKTDTFTYFYDHSYETYVDLTTVIDSGLDGCIGARTSVLARQGIRSDELGGMEEKGTASIPYHRLTNLHMAATPEHDCDSDKLTTAMSYQVDATIESAALGGGTDAETTVSWPDAFIPQVVTTGSYPKGTMTLTHKNSGGDYIVVVEFDAADGIVTITGPGAVPNAMPVTEFLALSEPELETEE